MNLTVRLRRTVRRVINSVLNLVGFQLNRVTGDSFPISERMWQTGIEKASNAVFSGCPIGEADATLSTLHVRDFYSIINGCPIPRAEWGSGFNTLLVLFVVTRILRPSLIIESGTFSGTSAWVFRKACPDAQVHCFDITFDNLRYRDPAITYHSHDWAERPLSFRVVPNSFGFFDDHVNQAKRIVEAQERGIRSLVFDDNVPAHALFRDGLPPVPTVDMLFDDSLRDGEILEWVSVGRKFRYIHDAAFAAHARSLIRRAHKFPELIAATGYAPDTCPTLVETF